MPANAFKDLSRSTIDVLASITKRAKRELNDVRVGGVETLCYIAEVHLDQPLRLHDLLDADNFNFAHDVLGILRHWDHEQRVMRDCFRPRYTA